MSLANFQFGPGSASRFDNNAGRNLFNQTSNAMRYPSPFFDIAHMYLPNSFKAMLRWCRYYFLTNPLINSVVYKMAEYPVTDLIFGSQNRSLKMKWDYFFSNVLQFKKFLVECGLDYYTFGNTFISIFFPFRKYLKCTSCGHMVRVDKQKKYTFHDLHFRGYCQRCNHYGNFEARDFFIRSAREIRVIRWNPENITVQHSDATGESEYYYTIPTTDQNDIRMGKRHVIEKCPQIFIETIRNRKHLKFSKDNLFHMKRPTIAQKDKGWGLPMILPVLKDTFYLQILRKAQEAIMIEHVVPMRLIFPQAGSASSDPYQNVNLTSWRNRIEKELLRWRLDSNYIPIMPLPIGSQTLGGDGKALNLSQEYRVWAEHIVAGMGVPIEFAFGGLSFSGSNVSMRMLENHFIEDRSNQLKLVTGFLMPRIGAYMGWQPIPAHFRRFKMADDLQRSAFNLQLTQAGKLSDGALLEELDYDAEEQAERIALEHKKVLETQRQGSIAQAVIQGESQLVMQKYQMRAQRAVEAQQQQQQQQTPEAGIDQGQLSAEPAPLQGLESPLNADQTPDEGAPPAGDVMALVSKIVAFLDQKSDAERAPFLAQLQKGNPQLYAEVIKMLQDRAGAHIESQVIPLPEQRPPRRGPEAQAV